MIIAKHLQIRPHEFDASSCGTSLCGMSAQLFADMPDGRYARTRTKGRASSYQLMHRAGGLLDRQMRIRVSAGVGVGDGDAAELLPCALESAVIVVLVVERVRHIAVAVWPAVDGDRCDVAHAGTSARPEHAVELVADSRREILKRHVEQLRLSDAKLCARVEPAAGRARNVNKMEADRFGRIACVAIAAEADGKIELHPAVKRHGRGDVVHAQPRP